MALDESGYIHRMCHLMTAELELGYINNRHNMNPGRIEKLIELELERLKAINRIEEECYTKQMLLRNPVIGERGAATYTSLYQPIRSRNPLDQLSDAFRNCRISNKKKKAELKYRQEFVSKKLMESTQHLQYIRGLIEHTEVQVMFAGFNQDALQKVRSTFGLNQCAERSETTAPYMPPTPE